MVSKVYVTIIVAAIVIVMFLARDMTHAVQKYQNHDTAKSSSKACKI